MAHRKGKGMGWTCYSELTFYMFTGWRGNFLLSAAEQWLKLELVKNFKVNVHSIVLVVFK